MPRSLIPLLLILAAFAPAGTAAQPDLGTCLAQPPSAVREACLENAVRTVLESVPETRPADTVLLAAPEWFRPLPDVTVPMLDGDPVRLSDLRGQVLLIDFWASWCAPCMIELPFLQQLFAEESVRGLAAIAINADEPEATARRTVDALGLTVPIGTYTHEIGEAFSPRNLPTVLLVDRQGRIRFRWNGYAEGLAQVIARETRVLLAEQGDGPLRPLATVVQGHGRLNARWSRELPIPLSDVAMIRGSNPEPGLTAVGRGQLWTVTADGSLLGSSRLPAGVNRVSAVDNASRLLGFAPGTRTVWVMDGDRPLSWEAPAPVRDINEATEDGVLLISTDEGVFRVGADGTAPERLGPAAAPASLPGGVRSAVVGRFLPGTGRQAAISTADGQLMLIELATGELRFRAEWARIGRLGAGDLDGDGQDELIVSAGRSLTVLEGGGA